MELRREHLKKQIESLEQFDDTESIRKVRILRRILAAETIQTKWNSVQAQMSTTLRSTLGRLEVPGEEGEEMGWTTLYDPIEIQDAIISRNEKHFQQAQQTQFGNGALSQLLGFEGLTAAADDIVDGSFVEKHEEIIKDHIDEVQELAVAMAMPKAIRECGKMKTEISKMELKEGMKKWKESTTTSPSGRHLGHYKAWVEDNQLCDILLLMINIPIKYGFAPERWKGS